MDSVLTWFHWFYVHFFSPSLIQILLFEWKNEFRRGSISLTDLVFFLFLFVDRLSLFFCFFISLWMCGAVTCLCVCVCVVCRRISAIQQDALESDERPSELSDIAEEPEEYQDCSDYDSDGVSLAIFHRMLPFSPLEPACFYCFFFCSLIPRDYLFDWPE